MALKLIYKRTRQIGIIDTRCTSYSLNVKYIRVDNLVFTTLLASVGVCIIEVINLVIGLK